MFSRAALGYRHTFGLGVPKSCWTAVSYYQPVAEAVVQGAVDAAKDGPMGSTSGHGLPQIERIRLNVHANQGIKPDRQVGTGLDKRLALLQVVSYVVLGAQLLSLRRMGWQTCNNCWCLV